jgi:flagellar biosynthesis protein FlhA
MSELGLVLPVVRIRDNLRLPPQAYRIKIRGQEVASGELLLDRLLAIPGSEADEIHGIATTEPAFGLPAYWITEAEQSQAEIRGCTVATPSPYWAPTCTKSYAAKSLRSVGSQLVQEMLIN